MDYRGSNDQNKTNKIIHKTNDVNIAQTQTNDIAPQIAQYITNLSNSTNSNNKSQNLNNNSNNNNLNSNGYTYKYTNPKIRRAFATIGDLNFLHSNLTSNPSIANNISLSKTQNNDDGEDKPIKINKPIIPEMPILSIDTINFIRNSNKLQTNMVATNLLPQQSVSPQSTINTLSTVSLSNTNSINTIQSLDSSNINNKSDDPLPAITVHGNNNNVKKNVLQQPLFNIMGAYDDAHAKSERKQQSHVRNTVNTNNKKHENDKNLGNFVCTFSECNNKSFNTQKNFNEHINIYHDVGLELRFIALASETMTRKFPEVNIQCPYINCDIDLYFNCVDDVIEHLETKHDEDLKEIMETNDAKIRNINTMFEAAKYVMLLGKVPIVFDDNVIYCCPFTKNEICPTKCFVEDADGLIQHLQSFHALNINDAQFIINVLRFIELKPVWRYWSNEKRRDRIHKRLDALLKYRGNVRKGFVKQYKNQYSRKYLKDKVKLNKMIRSHKAYNEIQNNINVSVLNSDDLFDKYKDCNNIGIDKEIFEQIIQKILVKKYGYECNNDMNNEMEMEQMNNNSNNNGYKRYRTNYSDSNSTNQLKRRRLNNGHY